MKRPSALVPVIAGFGVMLLLLAAVTAIGVTYVGWLSEQLTAIVAERNEKSELATAMRAIHEARHQALMLACDTTDPFLRDEELMRFSRLAREFIQDRDKFLSLPLDQDEMELWGRIRDEARQVEEHAERVVDLLQEERLQDAKLVNHHTLLPLQIAMMAKWGELVEMQRAKNKAAMAEARKASSQARGLTVGLSAGAFLVGLVIAVFVVRLSRRLEHSLYEEKEAAEITLQAIDEAVLRFDTRGQLTYLNPVAENLLGLDADSLQGHALVSLLHLYEKSSRSDLTQTLLADTLQGTRQSLPGMAYLQAASGLEYEVEGSSAPIHDSKGAIQGGVLVLRDVTESRADNRRLIWKADHDELTGLLNRHALENRLLRVLASKRGADHPMSLLYIDLNQFRQINEQAGHAAGNEMLRRLAMVMRDHIRDSDLLARMAGDEFAILLRACPVDMARTILQNLKESLDNHVLHWEGQAYQVSTSIGLVQVSPQWSGLDECLAAAVAACAQAKQEHAQGQETAS